METVLVQINDIKAYKLLKDLEDLNILTVLENKEKPWQSHSEKYAGKLSSSIGDALQHHITQGRNEWNNRNI